MSSPIYNCAVTLTKQEKRGRTVISTRTKVVDNMPVADKGGDMKTYLRSRGSMNKTYNDAISSGFEIIDITKKEIIGYTND